MTTSASSNPRFQRAFVPSNALAKAVDFDDAMMRVSLVDGRVIAVPVAWFPILKAATPAQRSHYEICGGGVSLHWPDLDEDLSVAGLLAGADRHST
jgi:hypothetical protein